MALGVFTMSVAGEHPSGKGMSDGLIEINYIELQGDALYPEYGITEGFLDSRIDQIYSLMGNKLSISDINRIADSITLLYREKGLTFNKAYVIPQEIKHGTLRIHVLKGTLAEIDIYDNKLYTQAQLLAPFENLMGKTIYEPAIKEAIESLSNKPGLKLFSYFSMGTKQGESRLNIKVTHEKSQYSSLTVDNHGVKQTGQNRLMFSYVQNNPFNFSGAANLQLLTTSKENNLFGGLAYAFPVGRSNDIGFSFIRSEFAVAGQFESLGLEGELTALSAYWSHKPQTKDKSNFSKSQKIIVSTKNSNVSSDEFSSYLSSEVTYTQLTGIYQLNYVSDDSSKAQHSLSLKPNIGVVHTTDHSYLSSDFWLLRSRYQHLRPNWIKPLKLNHYLNIDLNGQWTTARIPASEQFITSGATANRGFEPGIFSSDWGGTLSIENVFHIKTNFEGSLKSLVFQPFLFFDMSYGGLVEGRGSSNFKSAGFGINASNELSDDGFLQNISSSITAGYPLSYNLSEQDNDLNEELTVYGRLNLTF
jgi:hemolysin activation/secretion protein